MLISTGFPSLSYSYNLLRLSVCFPIQLILLHGGTTIYKRLLDIQSLSLPGGPRDPMVGCICVVLARRIWREPGVYSPMIAYAAACCCLPAAPCCCLLLVLLLVAAAAAVVLLQSNSLQSKKQTARHPFRNTSETAKHHLISCPKRSKGTPKKGLTSLLKPYLKLELCRCLPLPAAACCCLLLPAAASAGVCCCLLLPAAASAGVCCCLLLPAAACSCLRLPAAACLLLPAAGAAAGAAAGGCCCCCCGAAAIKQPPKQETNSQTPFSKHIRNSKTPPNFVPKT